MKNQKTRCIKAKVWKLISTAVGLCFWLSSCALSYHFAYTRPAVQQPKLGRIYPLNTHGDVVYLNSYEHFLLYALMAVGFVLIITTIGSQFFEKRLLKEKG
jgi:hypothetical protein